MKKLIASLVVFGVLFTSSPAHALTLSDLQKEVESLRQEIASLKSMMSGSVLGVTASISYSLGMKSTDLIKYQQSLIDQKYLAPGNATGVFGPLTYSAVKNFQTAKGLKADGVLGAQTQSLLTPVLITEGQEPICVPNTWTREADFGGIGRHSAVGFSLNNKGYVGTGWGNAQNLKDFWEYNYKLNSWTQKADFGGEARSGAVSFVINNIAYVGTGSSSSSDFYTKDFWSYDPVLNTWTRKADFGGDKRAYAVAFSVNGKGYIGTGLGAGIFSDFWEYNPKLDTWTRKADFGGGARSSAIGFSYIDKGYVGTGHTGNSNNVTRDFWEYNPTLDTWTRKADFGGIGRQSAFSFVLNSTGYVGGGRKNSNTSVSDLWAYNFTENVWSSRASIVGPGYFTASFVIDNKGFVSTGANSKITNKYCPN